MINLGINCCLARSYVLHFCIYCKKWNYVVHLDYTGFVFSLCRMDTFRLEGIDLGELIKLRIGHDNRGVGPGWFLDKVSNYYNWILIKTL